MDCAFPRLHVVTDARPGREPLRVVRAAVDAAVRLDLAGLVAVQVRVEDDATDRQAYELTLAVLALCRPAGVLCLVNDRLHVAVGAGAGGGHVGPDDLPVAPARRALNGAHPTTSGSAHPAVSGSGHTMVLGVTCREPVSARAAVEAGATYLGVGPTFATTTKRGLPDPIGPAGVGAVAAAVPGVPVIAIGGVDVASVPVLLAAGAHGVAVVGALSGADDPGRVTTDLLRALREPHRSVAGREATRRGDAERGDTDAERGDAGAGRRDAGASSVAVTA